jgi:hypothetical protein
LRLDAPSCYLARADRDRLQRALAHRAATRTDCMLSRHVVLLLCVIAALLFSLLPSETPESLVLDILGGLSALTTCGTCHSLLVCASKAPKAPAVRWLTEILPGR